MKIYTKTGDAGETSLFSGKRVSKTHELIESFGLLDELNTAVGSLVQSLKQEEEKKEKKGLFKAQTSSLTETQSHIFSVGSFLASEFSQIKFIQDVEQWIQNLETEMDSLSVELPELKNFILPGGSNAACKAHVCRVLTRNVERRVVSLDAESDQCQSTVVFLNRLSDYFFVLARFVNFKMNVEEPIWKS